MITSSQDAPRPPVERHAFVVYILHYQGPLTGQNDPSLFGTWLRACNVLYMLVQCTFSSPISQFLLLHGYTLFKFGVQYFSVFLFTPSQHLVSHTGRYSHVEEFPMLLFLP